MISVGDNFYPRGVVSEMDPLWHYSFESIYSAHALQCDWLAVLGNHDYLSEPDAQIRYGSVSGRWHMPARYYAKELPLGKTQDKLLFVMIDSNQMLDDDLREKGEEQLKRIDSTLQHASADVKWKIVVGHHPYYTVGPRIRNEETLTMRKVMSAIFQDNKVDIYLSGHEHSLQHLKPDGCTHQFISGSGSELSHVASGIPYARFQAAEHGFMYFSVNPDRLNVKAINYEGKVLYDTELRR